MTDEDRARLRSARWKLLTLGFSANEVADPVVAWKGPLTVQVSLMDELLGERNDSVRISMPGTGDEPFRFGVHAGGAALEVILHILGQTADALQAGDPEPFAELAKQAGLTWFAE